MKMCAPLRCLLLAISFVAFMYADDITIPLDGGSIVVENAQFIREIRNSVSRNVAGLTFTLTNHTSSWWTSIDLRFDITYVCSGEVHRRSDTVKLALGPIKKEYHDLVISLMDKVDDCGGERIKATLISARNSTVRIDGVTGERIDLVQQEQERAKKAEEERVRQAATKAEEDRIAAEEQAKSDAAEAIRRKRLAAEQKRKESEANARYAKTRAEEDAKTAEERRKVSAVCSVVYQNTIDKKVKDLTVREEQQVRACQALGLYPPL